MKKAIGCLFILIAIAGIGYMLYLYREEVTKAIEKYRPPKPQETRPDEQEKAVEPEEQISEESNFQYDFILRDLEGKTYSLNDFKGKVVLLDFWATWCQPCRMAIPYLCEIYADYRDRGLIILGIACEDIMFGMMQNFIIENNIKYPILEETDEVKEKFNIQAIPALFLFNQNGNLVFKEIGFSEENITKLKRKIVELLGSPDTIIRNSSYLPTSEFFSTIDEYIEANAGKRINNSQGDIIYRDFNSDDVKDVAIVFQDSAGSKFYLAILHKEQSGYRRALLNELGKPALLSIDEELTEEDFTAPFYLSKPDPEEAYNIIWKPRWPTKEEIAQFKYCFTLNYYAGYRAHYFYDGQNYWFMHYIVLY